MTTLDTIGEHSTEHLSVHVRAGLPAYRALLHSQHMARANLALRLDNVEDPVALSVLVLHSRRGNVCRGCDRSGSDLPDWPCDTVLVTAAAAGVPIPEPFAEDLAAAQRVGR